MPYLIVSPLAHRVPQAVCAAVDDLGIRVDNEDLVAIKAEVAYGMFDTTGK